ncbi:MAG: CCA tRNA nucleotidyltransferase [Pseudomonadota bacterium]
MSNTPDFPFLRESPLADVLRCLNGDGAETRVVGGAVRNVLLQQSPGDVDLATTLLPDAVIERARDAGFRAVPTGIEHGTVTVVADDVPFEVTTLRQDIKTHGRHADVEFGTDWDADAERRDFTMNALYLGADGTVYDPVSGLDDIAARRVRFIGDPQARIAEDYLRILRFFRFHAGYSDSRPDPDVLAVIKANLDGLAAVSAERVRMELAKMLPMTEVLASLEAMHEIGLLKRLIGPEADPAPVGWLAVLQRAVEPPAPETAWVLRLGAMAGWCGVAGDIAARLRLSNAESERLGRFLANMATPLRPDMSEDDAKVEIYRLGNDAYLDRLAASWTVNQGGSLSAHARLAALAQHWSPPDFPVTGRDLATAGIEPGPQLGASLRDLEEAWIASGFALTREQLIERIGQTLH